jgi:hypothetical protein
MPVGLALSVANPETPRGHVDLAALGRACMGKSSFFAELKRRNVLRAATFHAASAWMIVQVATQLFLFFHVAEWVIRWTPEGIKHDDEVTAEESIAWGTARRMDRMIIAALALALLYFGFDTFVLAPRREAALVASAQQQTDMKSTVVTASDDKSTAMLPLANETGDKGQQYFSDGLSEDLIAALSQFTGLKVGSRNSAYNADQQSTFYRNAVRAATLYAADALLMPWHPCPGPARPKP